MDPENQEGRMYHPTTKAEELMIKQMLCKNNITITRTICIFDIYIYIYLYIYTHTYTYMFKFKKERKKTDLRQASNY